MTRRAPNGRLYVPSSVRMAKAAARPRPYPVENLAPHAGIGRHDPELTGSLARALGLHRRTVRRARMFGGLTRGEAEGWAARADVHPAEVWPNWHSEAEAPAAPTPAWMSRR